MTDQGYHKISLIKSWLARLPENIFGRFIGISVILLSFATAWYLMDYEEFKQSGLMLPESDTFYELKSGASINSVAADFDRRGWIKHGLYLKLLARFNDINSVQAGEYQLKAGLKPIQLLEMLKKGKVIQYRFTLIEGWSFKQLLEALSKNDQIKQTLNGLSREEIKQKLGLKQHPEGLFLPETYTFSRGTTDIDVLLMAKKAMENTLEKAWQGRQPNLPLKNKYEALTLASIVEKETGLASERPLIAGVFVSRLQKKMKLQTDPTVIYGMGDNYKGNIRRKHLKQDTPYNTYVHFGLTPTPIAMPGPDAIKAVMHPEQKGYLYFVSRGDGSHYFSKTLAEHNKAVRKYQLKKK